MAAPPKVTMVLTTRDRPGFLPIALRCFQHQTWPNKELVVVDDGDVHPADESLVRAHGGILVRVPTGTVLGEKLNIGIERATGALIQKMDDDDWYSPTFVENTAGVIMQRWQEACRPVLAYTAPFLFFHIAAWELRRSTDNNLPGATMCFPREMWEYHPFRHVPSEEDLWFYRDHQRFGTTAYPTRVDVEHFIAIRHTGSGTDRQHTWQRQWSNQPLEDYLSETRPLHTRTPEEAFAPWAVERYRAMRDDILARQAGRS
jgi:hypothetical protein